MGDQKKQVPQKNGMLPIPAHVDMILAALRRAGYEAYPVGGCVRDGLLGRIPEDWDVCTAARPGETEAVFAGFRLIETGIRHGTVTVLTSSGPVEVTTFRTDGTYADSRHPEHVTFVTRLQEDLARRDFTVNAMALGTDGQVIDLYGGQKDLAAGMIRCVGDPNTRFREDALRILRALRLAARLDFSIEPATARSAAENRALLAHIAPERIYSELKGLLTGQGAGRVLRDCAGVIFEIIPELKRSYGFDQKSPYHIHDIWTHTTMAVDAIAPDAVLRLTMLLHDVGKPACFFTDGTGTGHFYGHADTGAELAEGILRRLRCDNDTRNAVVTLIRHHDMAPPQTARSMGRLVRKLGADTVRQLIQCWRADNADRTEAVRRRNLAVIGASETALEEFLQTEPCFSVKDLAVNGRDIMALNVREGPAVGAILKELFRQTAEGELPNTRRALLDQARVLAACHQHEDREERIDRKNRHI